MNVFLAMLAPDQPMEPVLRPNETIVDVPWPVWVWVLIAVGAVLALAGILWAIRKFGNRQSVVNTPVARDVARKALMDLGERINVTPTYDFSIAVSDILRTFITSQFNVRASQQTSPEFLAGIATHVEFTEQDKQLLAKFLERCDRIKFAREEGSVEDSMELMSAAVAFVKGGQG